MRALLQGPDIEILRPISREQIVKRIITIIIVVGLVVPAVAVASRVATGSTRIAIERAAAPELVGHSAALPGCPGDDQGWRQLGHRRLQRGQPPVLRTLGVQRRRY